LSDEGISPRGWLVLILVALIALCLAFTLLGGDPRGFMGGATGVLVVLILVVAVAAFIQRVREGGG
jgi:hypothetical protein